MVVQKITKLTSVIITIIASIIVGSGIVSSVFADNPVNVNYSVTVEPALNITTSSNKVSLDLNPLNHDFDSQDLTVSVSTNNETGYKLYVNTEKTTNNPNGNKLIEKDDNSLYIETLSSETPENNFTSNRWGYRIGSGNYLPFASGTLINSSKTQVENNASTLTFAAKVGYETKAGTYNLALNFRATANPKCNTTVEGTMQEFDPCPDLEDGTKGSLTDSRDDQIYTVAKINGNYWMTRNLAIGCNGSGPSYGSSAISKALSGELSNVANSSSDPWNTPTASLTLGNSYTEARMECSSDYGAWYNYAAASAGTVTGSSTNADAPNDICPKGWNLPSALQFNSVLNYKTQFDATGTGRYGDGGLAYTNVGYWWGSTSGGNGVSYRLLYSNDSLVSDGGLSRTYGFAVRCARSA